MKMALSQNNILIVRLDHGDDILASIGEACRLHNFHNATVSGIGSVDSPTLAHYRMDSKHFTEKKLDGIFEIVSLIGNVGMMDSQPLAHAHVTVSDQNMQTSAGHLKAGICSATTELIIQQIDSTFTKAHDEGIGLNIWQLP